MSARSPRRLNRLILAASLAAALASVPAIHAARVGIFTEQDRANDQADQINTAIEKGDAAHLLQLISGSLRPIPVQDHLRLTPALARAYLLLGQPERALPFALDAYARTHDADAAWLAAELLYATDDFALGDRIARELRERAPYHPALPYLEVRRLLARFILGDADTDWPALREQLPAARQAAMLAAAGLEDNTPGADPRFLTAGLELALFELDYPRAADFAARLSALRPRNPGLARLALACAFPVEARRSAILREVQARDTLPVAEHALWTELAARLASAPDPVHAWTSLAEATVQPPGLAAARLVFLERALASVPETPAALSSPALPALLSDYDEAARQARSFPHAANALALRDKLRLLAPDFPALPENESSVRLLSLAARPRRAAELAVALLPAHRDDFEWLARNRSAAARHPAPRAYLDHLLAMEALRPEDPRTLLELARALDRDTQPRALAIYRRVFALCPREIRPQAKDWFALENLLQAAAARRELASDEARDEFDAMTERIHRDDDTYAVAAHFHARLLERRAVAARSPEAHQVAHEAYRRAMMLDPFASDIFARLGRSHSVRIP